MKGKLNCPVCDRSNIEGNICPNCETDLSLLEMLAELPKSQTGVPYWLVIVIVIMFFLLGIYLTFASEFVPLRLQSII